MVADELEKAIAAHGMWKSRLRGAISTGKLEVKLEDARADDKCEFGRWLHGNQLTAEEKGSPHFRRAVELHREFHAGVADVAKLILLHRSAEATRELDGKVFVDRSSSLTRELMTWRKEALAGATAAAPAPAVAPAASSERSAFSLQIERALAAHAMWKARLLSAIETGKVDAPVAKIRASDQCEFGKWLLGAELQGAERGSADFRTVEELHRRFHLATAQVVMLAVAGKKKEAELALRSTAEFGRVSAELTKALVAWQHRAG